MSSRREPRAVTADDSEATTMSADAAAGAEPVPEVDFGDEVAMSAEPPAAASSDLRSQITGKEGVQRDAAPPRSAAPDLRAIAEEKMAEEAADEEAAAKAEDDEAAADEDAFPFSHLRDLARSDAPMAYSLVGHSRVSADGGA